MMTDQEKLLNLTEVALNNSLKLKNKINHLLNLDRKIIILQEEQSKMKQSSIKLLDKELKQIKQIEDFLGDHREEKFSLNKQFTDKIDQISEEIEAIHQKLKIRE